METVQSGLVMRYLPDCAPLRVDTLTVEALGDFPAGPGTVAAFDTRTGAGELRGLPPAARLWRVRAQTSRFDGVAIAATADDGRSFDALVLPLGVHCAALDADLPVLLHAATAALPGGDVLVAGGVSEGEGKLGRREARRIHVASGGVTPDPAGMFLPRTLASAVAAGGQVWIVGGAQSELSGSPALDSFERYDVTDSSFAAPGRLSEARARAGIVRLLDGRVLVAGGESSVDGSALDSLELLSVDGTSTPLTLRLPWPAVSPQLLVRDDGLVWVTAQVDSVPRLALLDAAAPAIEERSWSSAGEPGPIVLLPGGHLALFELREGATTGVVRLLLRDGDALDLSDWLTPFSDIRSPLAATLNDGRVLLTGETSRGPTARVIDLGRRQVSVRALDVLPTALLVRDDGSVAELSSGAVRVVREDSRTAYDNPGGTLLADDGPVALDAETRWQRDGLALVALAPFARFELAGLRYENVIGEITFEGEGEILLRRADGAERSFSLAADEVGPSLCKLATDGADSIAFERRGENVRVRAGRASRTCRLEGMTGPITLGFRALTAGTRVTRLTLTRE